MIDRAMKFLSDGGQHEDQDEEIERVERPAEKPGQEGIACAAASNQLGGRIGKLGFAGLIKPLKVTCANHTGIATARVFQWDGKAWNFVSDWIDSDQKLVRPMIEAAAKKYAADKSLPADSCKTS